MNEKDSKEELLAQINPQDKDSSNLLSLLMTIALAYVVPVSYAWIATNSLSAFSIVCSGPLVIVIVVFKIGYFGDPDFLFNILRGVIIAVYLFLSIVASVKIGVTWPLSRHLIVQFIALTLWLLLGAFSLVLASPNA